MQRSVASLRISGEELLPEEVTSLLGRAPSHSYAKGDEHVFAPGRVVVKKFGFWSLQATDAAPESLDAQVAELLGQLPSNLDVWRRLTERFEVDLFCGWFMGSSGEGVEVAASTLAALGERGIKLGVCVYAPDADGGTDSWYEIVASLPGGPMRQDFNAFELTLRLQWHPTYGNLRASSVTQSIPS